MRRSILLATTLAVGLLLLDAPTAYAQPGDPYPALSRGAVDYAEMTANTRAGTGDLYLIAVNDYGGELYGFTLDTGASAAWGYQFYSSTHDSVFLVIVGSQSNTVFGTLLIQAAKIPGIEPPAMLDTSGAFVQSSAFATALRADADFNAYRAANPNALGPYVGLAPLGPDPRYPPPPTIATDLPVWVASMERVADSIHVCYLATGTGALSCSTYFNKGIEHFDRVVDNGNMAFGVSNYGNFGGDRAQQAASFVAPGGSGNAYVFGAGLWVGARKRIDGTLQPRSFITYDPNSGESWATAGEGYVDRSTWSFPELFASGSYDRNTGVSIVGGDFNWPLWATNASGDVTLMNPGTFVPLNANRAAAGNFVRPAFVAGVADQFIARYTDVDTLQYFLNLDNTGFPLGLQFQENVFANPGGLDHTAIVSYEVINRSSDTLTDVVLAMVTDFDIGTPANDRTRFYGERPDLRSAVAWSANEARPTPYGMLVMTLIEAPMTNQAGQIDNSRRRDYRTEGIVGTFQAWKIAEDPTTSTDRFNFMSAGERDGDQGAGDYRGLLASESFTMLPGDTAHFAFSLVINRGKLAVAGADPALETRIANIMNVYYGLEFAGVQSSASIAGGLSLAAAPNPASDVVALRLNVSRSASATIEIFDHLGNRLLARELGVQNIGEQIHTVDISSLSSGSYFVVASCGAERVSVPIVVAR